MLARLALYIAAAALAATALPAQTQWVVTRLEDIEVKARLIQDVSQIEALLGDPLDKEFMLVEIEIKPYYGRELTLERTHFTLRSRADNESSKAQSPSRIAGSAVFSLEQKRRGGGGVFAQSQDPLIIGGAPGTSGQPRRIDGVSPRIGGTVGGGTEVSVRQTESKQPETLEGRLARLELPFDPTEEDIRGYLYFQVDPKNKLKRIVFYYDGVHGEFQHQFEKQ